MSMYRLFCIDWFGFQKVDCLGFRKIHRRSKKAPDIVPWGARGVDDCHRFLRRDQLVVTLMSYRLLQLSDQTVLSGLSVSQSLPSQLAVQSRITLRVGSKIFFFGVINNPKKVIGNLDIFQVICKFSKSHVTLSDNYLTELPGIANQRVPTLSLSHSVRPCCLQGLWGSSFSMSDGREFIVSSPTDSYSSSTCGSLGL